MLDGRKKLGFAMFVLADFGRYLVELANLKKDIIAPYRHLGGAIRQELYYLLKDEKDVHLAFGSIKGNGINQASQGMASSKFCLNIAGDTPSSNHLFDAIVSHCVRVIISDEIELPFEDVLDYSEFCIFVRAFDAVRKGYLLNLLHSIKQDKWTKMWERLKEITHHFEYQYPSHPGDAVNLIWEEVARKISSMRFNLQTKGLSFLLRPTENTETLSIDLAHILAFQWERTRTQDLGFT